MNVIEELEEKINNYIEEQTEEIQNNFTNLEDIKDLIDFKVYLAQKLINMEIEEGDDETAIDYNYISKDAYHLSINTNIKLLYKNKPFLIVDTDNFILDSFADEENAYYLSLLFALNQNWDDLNHEHDLWFFIPHCQVDENNLESLIQFILLINGQVFHSPIEVSEKFLEDDIKNILECDIKNFNQYQESAYILSEYNHTQDILLKYLLLYHIIENFMYRQPIAEMANNRFSIRDFKNLYKKVDLTEEKTLKELLTKIKFENITSTTKIEEYFTNNMTSFKVGLANQNEMNEILSKMTLQNLNGLNYSNASKLIYFFRNSIIHNKETEFHITHTVLNNSPDLVKFFEEFLLPTLENIIYFLIFQENSIIDYPKNHLLLYGEDCIS